MKTFLIVLSTLIPTIANSFDEADRRELSSHNPVSGCLEVTTAIGLSPLGLPFITTIATMPVPHPAKVRTKEAYKLARDYMRVGANRYSRLKWEAFSNDYYGRKATKLELRNLARYVMRVNR